MMFKELSICHDALGQGVRSTAAGATYRLSLMAANARLKAG